MFRPIRVDHTNCLQVAIKTHSFIFDEYANILKGMYSTRFNGRPKNKGDHDQMDTVPDGPSPPLITSLQAWQPNNIRRQKEQEGKGVG